MILTKEQQEALLAIRDLVTSETRSDYIDNAIDILDELLSSTLAWKVTEERQLAIKNAIAELKDAEELVYEKDINVLKSMIEKTVV